MGGSNKACVLVSCLGPSWAVVAHAKGREDDYVTPSSILGVPRHNTRKIQ